ncbi:hypothetical protein HME01_18280 [Vreelandella aquamarina]|uniref:Uncharacterized conserved protein, DUF2252 family n=1 Tax=Vreelandella aquamarina TaxID=77097 RepID=A0A1N6FIY9_9GAMM|nr:MULTISPECIES: DUF2252 family protein [Halomonas]MDC8442217.1 DUF2252 family protein [Halomonas aquamarina]SIN61666.1 Uncharacterized conserved protein, DUF2252 family [Halomonas meridiana]SIN67255.1 Uncharacterized conserved protein, DUF2252 family [Halomonas meridiana]SIN95239.1 Uncharacterized conserved protein, DUF2252 family [Halomonas meridiana]BCB70979.1 hypothetical protein HMEPL2_13300 [Halomonas meridiana]
MSHALTGHNRPQQVIEAIQQANAPLSTAHRQAKYAKMAASPYRFFRGSNHLYWQDVWHDWRFALFGGWPNTQTWLQGDAHAYNFGAYGHHDDQVRYGMDDFDDALIGDYQYDVWRLAISLVLDARENAELSPKAIDKALNKLLEGYMDTLSVHREDDVAIHAITLDNAKDPLKSFMGKVADKQSRARMLEKWTTLDPDKGRQFAERPGKLANLPADVASQLRRIIEQEYQQTLQHPIKESDPQHFFVKDTARRLDAGTGSLGVERYYVLIEGGADHEHDDVILDIKEQVTPEAYRLMDKAQQQAWRKLFPNEGIRHAAAFHAIAEHPDAYLGWLTMNGKVFSVRERSPFKKDYPTHKLSGGKAYRKLARQWGEILAREHLRGAQALNRGKAAPFADAVCQRLEGREEQFIGVVSTLAKAYADCVAQDYQVFLEHFLATDTAS